MYLMTPYGLCMSYLYCICIYWNSINLQGKQIMQCILFSISWSILLIGILRFILYPSSHTHIHNQNCTINGASSSELNQTFPLEVSSTYFPRISDEKSGLLAAGTLPWSLFLSRRSSRRWVKLLSSGGIKPVNPFDWRFLQQRKLINSENPTQPNFKQITNPILFTFSLDLSNFQSLEESDPKVDSSPNPKSWGMSTCHFLRYYPNQIVPMQYPTNHQSMK